jgi:hypothetical protein
MYSAIWFATGDLPTRKSIKTSVSAMITANAHEARLLIDLSHRRPSLKEIPSMTAEFCDVSPARLHPSKSSQLLH